MPNVPDTNNRVLSLRVPRELYYRVRKEAKQRGMEMTAFVRYVLNEEVLDVELTADEIKQIANEVKREEEKRNRN